MLAKEAESHLTLAFGEANEQRKILRRAVFIDWVGKCLHVIVNNFEVQHIPCLHLLFRVLSAVSCGLISSLVF